MRIPVVIEPIAGNGYRARSGEPLRLSAEGATGDEALRRLQDLMGRELHNGTQLVELDVPAAEQPHPLAKFIGMFKDDPLIEDWKKSMAEYRRKIDKTPELP